MNKSEKIDELLVNEEFQDEIQNAGTFSKKERILFQKKYSISHQEYLYAKRFFSGLSFDLERPESDEIEYAGKKLLARISYRKGEKNIVRGIFINISRIAAILTIPLLLTTIYFYKQASKSVANNDVIAEQGVVFNTYHAPIGAKTQVSLPDGSIVWLNSGSSISFPSKFDSKSRNVRIKGEGYFEVIKNAKVPMTVSANNYKVKVYGTKFNLNAFADNGIIETTLVEGKISIIFGTNDKEYKLDPGFSASYSIKNKNIEISKVKEMDIYTGWKDGKLVFQDQRLDDIIVELERWYNVDINLNDESLGDYVLYATFFDENIEHVLDIISQSIPISIKYPKRVKLENGNYSRKKIIIERVNT